MYFSIIMSVPCEMLLHPELLNNEQLICIIQERHLRIPDIHHMHRDELLELFHHYCVPYGQRKYRDSGRGKLLNKSRHLSPEPAHKLNIITSTRPKTNPVSERLKPPPDLLSGHMKRIKIETKTSPPKNNIFFNNVKRKMSIDDLSPVECTPPKKEKRTITWP